MTDTDKSKRWGIAAPGYPFILGGVLLVVLGWAFKWPLLTFLGLLGGGFFAYFFRDPERPIPSEPEAVVAPADGKVVFVDEIREDRYLRGPAKRLAIFMNVFDVHVNRAPVAGRVVQMEHRPGAFMAAFKHDAGHANEQQALMLEGEGRRRVLVVQIAGLLARRIVPFVREGQNLAKGERLGMICFGSRVDVYLPLESEILVKVGDRVKAGISAVARFK
ncbi:MAG: phosphatidylserine decarboxylase family protein [Deltaproteobacteria bacterium]|nr:phosphatidylserine decarboxylase family protein [Deltaproteobacteria bacterium]